MKTFVITDEELAGIECALRLALSERGEFELRQAMKDVLDRIGAAKINRQGCLKT